MKKITKIVVTAAFATVILASAAFAAVTMEQAKKIAFKKAGVSNNAVVLEQKRDHSDHFGMCYKFEFTEGAYKYEAKIVEATGEIVKFDMEKMKK